MHESTGAKRALKDYFFASKKNYKKVQKQTDSAAGALSFYFKIKLFPVFYCPPLIKDYLNPQVRIIKMVNQHRVNYHLSPS